MKILLATDAYQKSTNGAAGVVITLAEAMRADGHDVKVLTLSPNRHEFRDGDDYYLPSYNAVVYPELRQTMVRNHPYLDEIRQWGPDIIHFHTQGSIGRLSRSLAKDTGAPVVMTLHTDFAQYVFHDHANSPILRPLILFITGIFFRGADVATAPSEKAKNILKDYHYKQPVYVIPNGINQERFLKEVSPEERAALFKELRIPDNGKTFVCISRLSSEKKIHQLLDHFAALIKKDPDVRLLLVGDGPYMEHLIHHAAELGISDHVVFTGRIPQEQLYLYYKAGIAFLSASTFEIHSLTYLEASVCGLPLICREDPCLKGVLKNGVNGFTFRTEKEFVDSCLTLLNDKALQERFSKASKRNSERFSDVNCARSMVKLYQHVIDKSREPGRSQD